MDGTFEKRGPGLEARYQKQRKRQSRECGLTSAEREHRGRGPAPERQLEIIRTLTPAARPPSPVAPGMVIVTEPKSKHMETFT
jgi:hypothetical protein